MNITGRGQTYKPHTYEHRNSMTDRYDRYADDKNIALWSFDRELKVCPLDGGLMSKSKDEIRQEQDKREDELVMEELRKVADSVIDMFKTEADSPASHPELDYKMLILDMCVWMEKQWLSAPGMNAGNVHTACSAEGTCLPI